MLNVVFAFAEVIESAVCVTWQAKLLPLFLLLFVFTTLGNANANTQSHTKGPIGVNLSGKSAGG